MKKFLIIVVALACALTMFACGEESTIDLSAFNNAANSSKPTAAVLNIGLEATLGSLAANYNIAYAADGSATVEYSREEFNTAGTSDSVKNTVTGSVNCDASGKLADAAAFGIDTIPGTNFNFAADKMNNCTVNGNILSAVISAGNTEAVLGANYGADVTIVYTINDGKVASFALTYTTEVGTISIACAYTY